MRGGVARQLVYGKLKFVAVQNLQDRLQVRLVQVGLVAQQKIALGGQGQKLQLEAPRRGFHAKAYIGHATGHIGGHSCMGEFSLLIACNEGRIDLGFFQKTLQQKPRATAGLAIDEAQAFADRIGARIALVNGPSEIPEVLARVLE